MGHCSCAACHFDRDAHGVSRAEGERQCAVTHADSSHCMHCGAEPVIFGLCAFCETEYVECDGPTCPGHLDRLAEDAELEARRRHRRTAPKKAR
jgi:hypothetical protein